MSASTTEFTESSIEPTSLIRRRKAAMAAAGLTGGDMARQLGVTRATISTIVRGTNRSLRIRIGFARAVGLPVEQLFPVEADVAMIEAA